MKKLKEKNMYISLAVFLFFAIRFEFYCWRYSELYNFIHSGKYWIPAVLSFIIFLYFYLNTINKRRK